MDGAGWTTPAPLRTIENVPDACAVVPLREVAPEVVTIYVQVLLQDIRNGQRSTPTLFCPADAEPAVGLVSVLRRSAARCSDRAHARSAPPWQ